MLNKISSKNIDNNSKDGFKSSQNNLKNSNKILNFLNKFFKIFMVLVVMIGEILSLMFTTNLNISMPIKIVLMIVPEILLMLMFIFKWCKCRAFSRLSITLFYIFSLCVIVYSILCRLNILYIFSSVSSLKQFILSTGKIGVFIYILIQLLQVVFLPIPASVICIVGSLIYGPWLGGLYCSIGVLSGSFISFIIGKVFGYKIVAWIVGKENTDKYADILKKRGGFFLALAFLLPMFPDDILCFIAGITNMDIKTFVLITITTRPIGVICMAIFGGGYIIPFSGWGIYAWIAILILAVAFVFILMKYQDAMQNFILNKVFRKNVGKKAKLGKSKLNNSKTK